MVIKTGSQVQDTTTFFLQTFDNHDFQTFKMRNTLHLKNDTHNEYDVGLVKMKIWLTMQNIHSLLTNNQIRWEIGGVPTTTPISDGNYGLSELNNVLSDVFLQTGVAGGFIQFEPDTSSGKLKIILSAGARVDFTTGANAGIGLFLGFSVTQDADNTLGANPLIITADNEPRFNYFHSPSRVGAIKIDSIYVHSDLTSGKGYHNSTKNNGDILKSDTGILHKFTPIGIPNSLMIEEPINIHYSHMVSATELPEFVIKLTNQDNQNLDGMITKPIYYNIVIRRN